MLLLLPVGMGTLKGIDFGDGSFSSAKALAFLQFAL